MLNDISNSQLRSLKKRKLDGVTEVCDTRDVFKKCFPKSKTSLPNQKEGLQSKVTSMLEVFPEKWSSTSISETLCKKGLQFKFLLNLKMFSMKYHF